MNQKAFLNGLSNGKSDIIQELLDILKEQNIKYCVIGGLAVNAYVEPVVSLDLDIVIISDAVERLIEHSKDKFKVEKFPHIINLNSRESDIRIQIQIDERYQNFLENAAQKKRGPRHKHLRVACHKGQSRQIGSLDIRPGPGVAILQIVLQGIEKPVQGTFDPAIGRTRGEMKPEKRFYRGHAGLLP